MGYLEQSQFTLRCEWGPQGVAHLKSACDVLIIVDILSFSTCVDVALNQNAIVLPFAWKDQQAQAYATQNKALLAGKRDLSRPSLSPSSLKGLAAHQKLVLPSPNGATLSTQTEGVTTFCACFRNARAVASAAQKEGKTIGLIPAGERWSDGSLRPAIEDFLGVGAVLQYLEGTLSPEATLAKQAFEHFQWADFRGVISARELIERGFEKDVEIALEHNVSSRVPLYTQGRYQDQ